MTCKNESELLELREKYAAKCRQYDELRAAIRSLCERLELDADRKSQRCPICGYTLSVFGESSYCCVCDRRYAEIYPISDPRRYMDNKGDSL